jgi:2-desacetyl-2-hydroxyethyl bacteriochlorophyllide A dehydrogenase
MLPPASTGVKWKSMKRYSLYFVSPRSVEVREETLAEPAPDQVLVETICSAISPGTEMLVYRGEFPDMLVDPNIGALSGDFAYPLCYGYACIGRIKAIGKQVNKEWQDRLVFSFQPHCSHFLARPESLLRVPPDLQAEAAAFLPNMETAVNLVQDAKPILGERAMVFGQGIVGLLTASLLMEFPLDTLLTADRFELRRKASMGLGVKACLDPAEPNFKDKAKSLLNPDADLSIELSGSPDALNDAIAMTGFSGRIVIGSWYGRKPAQLDLGGSFHRSRIKLISSQVSSISPELSGRWDKSRRFEVAWQAIQRIQPQKWITHRFSLGQAQEAYRLLDESPEVAIQVMLAYS